MIETEMQQGSLDDCKLSLVDEVRMKVRDNAGANRHADEQTTQASAFDRAATVIPGSARRRRALLSTGPSSTCVRQDQGD
jgi:hypothetical protein